jgi:hypothetical protein
MLIFHKKRSLFSKNLNLLKGEEKTDPLKRVVDMSPDEDDLFSDCRSDYSDSRFNSTQNFLATTSPGTGCPWSHIYNNFFTFFIITKFLQILSDSKEYKQIFKNNVR